MSGDPPDGTDLSPVLVPVQRSGSPAGRRVRFVVVSWLLALAGVVALGLSGHESTTPTQVAPVAAAVTAHGTPVPTTPAPTTRAPATRPPLTRPIARRPVPQHRSLGNDGLMGGIVFGTNIREPEDPR